MGDSDDSYRIYCFIKGMQMWLVMPRIAHLFVPYCGALNSRFPRIEQQRHNRLRRCQR
jgi:hypothetical protein